MLKLTTKEITALSKTGTGIGIKRITVNQHLPAPLRAQHILLAKDKITSTTDGFHSVFTFDAEHVPATDNSNNIFHIPTFLDYLAEGDVVRFDVARRTLRTIYRLKANQNSLLVTERCNNFCLMCSQPPRDIDDSYLVKELLEAVPLMDRRTVEIGITGGEPTLLGDSLLELLWSLKNFLPETAVHMLSNGRRFADPAFAKAVSEVEHPDLMIGIPIYSDISNIHDYVVQADGAFDETIKGILNLKTLGVKVEVRVVIHKQTFERLPQLARFLARNLLFVDHVALMGLEMTGFTRTNIDELWIEPGDYQSQLVEAVETLARNRMRVSVYNHQLCLLDKRIWKYNVKSISDWKNEFMPECGPCTKKDDCGGFFSSAHFKYSSRIKPFQSTGAETKL